MCSEMRQYILKKAMTIFFVFIASLLLIEGVVRVVIVAAKPEAGLDNPIYQKYNVALQPKQNETASIILLGDSYMSLGIYPELLSHYLYQDGLKADVRNLAVPATKPNNLGVFFLKTLKKQDIKPNLVVVGISRQLFDERIFKNHIEKQQAPEFALKQSYLGQCVFNTEKDWYKQFMCNLSEVSYLVRYQGFLTQQLHNLPNIIFKTGDVVQYRSNKIPYVEISSKGWSPAFNIYNQQSYEQTVLQPVQQSFDASKEHLFVWTDEAIKPLMDYCKTNKINVLLMFMPEHPWHVKKHIRNKQHVKTQLTEEALSNRFKVYADQYEAGYVDFHDWQADASQYFDDTHLNTLGAFALTEKLSDLLTQPSYRQWLKPVSNEEGSSS